jgi:hypothetical protein
VVIEISIICITFILIYCIERGFFDQLCLKSSESADQKIKDQEEALQHLKNEFTDLSQKVSKHMLKGALK